MIPPSVSYDGRRHFSMPIASVISRHGWRGSERSTGCCASLSVLTIGMTQRDDVEALLAAAGPPRKNLRVGIVSFSNGYFHPKTVHIVRGDRSAAAYVGSANLTQNGVTSLNIEAGLLLDGLQGDDASVLDEIAGAIDWWFTDPAED